MGVVLSVCLPVEWIKMKLDTEVGLGPGHIVLDGHPAPSKVHSIPLLSVYVYCGQTVAHLSYLFFCGEFVIQQQLTYRLICHTIIFTAKRL